MFIGNDLKTNFKLKWELGWCQFVQGVGGSTLNPKPSGWNFRALGFLDFEVWGFQAFGGACGLIQELGFYGSGCRV